MAVVTTATLVKVGVKAGTMVVKKGLETAMNPEKLVLKCLVILVIVFSPIILIVALCCGVFSGVNGYVDKSMDELFASSLYEKIEAVNKVFVEKRTEEAEYLTLLTIPIPEKEEDEMITGSGADTGMTEEGMEEEPELTEEEKAALFEEYHISFEIKPPNLAYTLAYISHENEIASKWGNIFKIDGEDEQTPSFNKILKFYNKISVLEKMTYTDDEENVCTVYYMTYLSPEEVASKYWANDSVTQEMYLTSYNQFAAIYDIEDEFYIPGDAGDGSGNVLDIPVYYQTNNHKPFGGGTISSSGCAPTSLAMCLSYLTESTVTVNEVAAWAGNRFYVPGKGQSWSIFPAAASHWGCNARQVNNPSEVIAALESGCPVIASMEPGHFTDNGHFIVLCGMPSEGYMKVNDPNLNNFKKHGDVVPVDWVWNEAKGYYILSGGKR